MKRRRPYEIYQEPEYIPFNPVHLETVAIDALSENAFNWAVAQATGEPLEITISAGYEWINLHCTKRWDGYWGDAIHWMPCIDKDLLHEFLTKYLIGSMPVSADGSRWQAYFFANPALVAEAETLNKAVAKLLILGKFGDQVAVPFQLQSTEKAKQLVLDEEARAAELDRLLLAEEDYYLLEEQLRRQ